MQLSVSRLVYMQYNGESFFFSYRYTVNIFLGVTQMGVCTVYALFVAKNIEQVIIFRYCYYQLFVISNFYATLGTTVSTIITLTLLLAIFNLGMKVLKKLKCLRCIRCVNIVQ